MITVVFSGPMDDVLRINYLPEQAVPFPVYPSLQVHLKLPAVFVQFASV